MSVLEGIEPQRPLYYFEQISNIPRGSGDTDAISNYCVSFAKMHGLEYVQDECGNVVIYKKAYSGFEDSPTVILQGHIDMVCEKERSSFHDFTKDSLELIVEDGYLSANGTTLGADDGVAVCFMFAVLEDENIKAPALECVFTVDEEIGMLGADKLDMSLLIGRRMINLDNGEEGSLLIGCAGGITADCYLPVKKEEYDMLRNAVFSIEVSGLTGGHSGEEIIKQRANANHLLGRILAWISKDVKINIIRIQGGLKENAIPRDANVVVLTDTFDEMQKAIKLVEELKETIKKEYSDTDPDLNISAVRILTSEKEMFSDDSSQKLITTLYNLPNGIQKMSQKVLGMVQSSLNMGIVKMVDDKVMFSFSVRSDVKSEKEEMCRRMETLMNISGGYVEYSGDYPAWEVKSKSHLQSIMGTVYKELFSCEPKIGTIHAGLECGIFSDRLPGLDCVSIGPTMLDIHTPSEKLDLKSMERYWHYLIAILDRLK